MIHVSLKRGDASEIVSGTLVGHAANGEYGCDVVCAAVSSLAFNVVNSIETLAGFSPLVELDQEEGGYLHFEILGELTNKQKQTTQILLESFLLGLIAIEEEHSKFIRIEILSK
ncbi:MAG: ribosomal-processing cysteine protease Prp [Lactobacillales bacterium]|jgi:uncharacterized protein YsxB (DUF464 family)|nr:ribosomal-processing cysteine protease Prp [Lactobacillales bacterium]